MTLRCDVNSGTIEALKDVLVDVLDGLKGCTDFNIDVCLIFEYQVWAVWYNIAVIHELASDLGLLIRPPSVNWIPIRIGNCGIIEGLWEFFFALTVLHTSQHHMGHASCTL